MSELFDLTGRNAVVTGGGSGIGLAMAGAMAQAGATVEIWGRKAERLAAAAAALQADGVHLHTRQVDVTDEDDVGSGVEAAQEALGPLHVMVVNAGTAGPIARFVESRTEDYRSVLSTNLDGAYWTMREAARVMVGHGEGGSIIAVASLAATEGAGRNQPYGASKGGLLAMANGAAVELARHGIRVNSVLPGWIATDMTVASQASEKFTTNVIGRVPAGRWGRPDDFSGIAVYLASDASRYQTGTTVVIDGGYSMF